MDADQLGTLCLLDVGAPISLDSRAASRGPGTPHVVVKGTLRGVVHYLDEGTHEKRTRVEIATFGGQVAVCEFVDGDLSSPVTHADQPPSLF